MAAVKDWRGNEIKVGTTVVYPSRQSSSLWMNEAVVVSIEMVPHRWKSEQVPKIGVRRSRSNGWRGEHSKSERVSYPDADRITVVA